MEVDDFSATTDLYSVADNVYAMREFPFRVKDLTGSIVFAALFPFVTLALMSILLKVSSIVLQSCFCERVKDGAKMVARRVDTKPDEAIPCQPLGP